MEVEVDGLVSFARFEKTRVGGLGGWGAADVARHRAWQRDNAEEGCVRPSVRFDVFKRDGFSCGYCGRKPPAVTLEVDHIIPRVEGGGDDVENLVTSCWDCNRGKGAVPLDQDPDAIPSVADRTEIVREREQQLRAYHEAKAEEAARRDEQFNRVWNYWFELAGYSELPKWEVPWESSVRKYIDELGPDDVMEAMRIADERFPRIGQNTVKYFIGVCKRKVAEEEGRVKFCTYCGKRIILEPTDDKFADWHHVSCAEKANA